MSVVITTLSSTSFVQHYLCRRRTLVGPIRSIEGLATAGNRRNRRCCCYPQYWATAKTTVVPSQQRMYQYNATNTRQQQLHIPNNLLTTTNTTIPIVRKRQQSYFNYSSVVSSFVSISSRKSSLLRSNNSNTNRTILRVNHHYYYYYYYYSTTSNPHVKVNVHASCPYTVLNVPRDSSNEMVKQAFLQAALIYHPDRPDTGNTHIFVRIREAFEEIYYPNQNDNDNNNDTQQQQQSSRYHHLRRRKPSSKWKNETEFNTWFRTETARNGMMLAFNMEEQTRQEVITMYKTMNQSGHDKGGYWEMARIITENDTTDKKLNNSTERTRPSGLLPSGLDQQPDDGSSSSSIRRRKRKP